MPTKKAAPIGFDTLSPEEQALYRQSAGGPEPEPTPEPEPEPTPEPEPEPEPEQPEESGAERGPDPYESLRSEVEKLPANLRQYVESIRSENIGQRRALARRGQKLEQATRDREEALRAAVELNRRFTEQSERREEKKAEPRLPVRYDEEKGEYFFEPTALDEIIEQRVRTLREPELQSMQRERERQRMVSDIAAREGISMERQEHLASAFRDLSARVDQAVKMGAPAPQNAVEAARLIVDEGIDKEIKDAYGIDAEDVLDIGMGAIDPWRNGYQMARALRRNRGDEELTPPSAANGRPPTHTPPRAPVQSRSLARRGSPPAPPRRAIDDIIDADSEELLRMDPKDLQAKIRSWEKELSGRR